MSFKILPKLALLFIVLSGFLVLVLYFISSKLVSADPVTFTGSVLAPPEKSVALKVSQTGLGLISYLKIPVIQVEAQVIPVGITFEGKMSAPEDLNNVAWYDLGTYPGEIGSAVVVGHYGWKDNIPAVFDGLSKLRVGDKVYFSDEKGIETTFIVRMIKIYNEKDDTTKIFVSDDGKVHLNLITCGGVWNKFTKSYSDRLVVFTSKE